MTEFTCTKCLISKPVSEYHKKNTVRGHDTWCKPCKKDYRHDYFLKNQEREQRRSREKAWKGMGIDLSYETFLKMVEENNGKCEICGAEEGTSLHVDHCHEKHHIRGLLCGPCNKGLGQFKDNPYLLKQAYYYLQ